MMEYAKIVKALTANFVLLERMKILQPITVENFCDCENALIMQKLVIYKEEPGSGYNQASCYLYRVKSP